MAPEAIVIRADAGNQIGSGHLMRCLALAQRWKTSGGTVVFVTNCDSPTLRQRLDTEGFQVVRVEYSYPHEADWITTRDVLQRFPRAWCVVDGYNFDVKFHRAIRESDHRVLVVDDMAHLAFYDADAILNQNINAGDMNYNCAPDTRLLLGTR